MIETYSFADLDNINKKLIAGLVSAYTLTIHHATTEPVLAEVSAEEIMATELALVGFVKDSFAGFIRAKATIVDLDTDQVLQQVGSLIVLKEFRNQGVAGALIGQMTDLVVDMQRVPYAFCGPTSMSRFEDAGYEHAMPGQLPPEAVSQLGNAPMIYPVR